MKYIFDLDNTFVYTDQANNYAYNAALEKEGLPPIQSDGRITRETVRSEYPSLTESQMSRIIAIKKALYPVQKTYINADLLRYAEAQGKNHCFLWSSADPERVSSILNYHCLNEVFSDIFLSEKKDIRREFAELVEYYSFRLQDLTVYEDTGEYIEALRSLGVTVVDVKQLSSV